MAINENPTFNQEQLAQHLNIHKSNISTHIKELRAKGYIDAKKLLVTPLGKNHLETLK